MLIQAEVNETDQEETLISKNDHEKRPSLKGPYRPERNGTIRGSIFAMLASALGTGCLNLPFKVSQLGLIPFMLILLIVAALSYYGMFIMELIIIKYKVVSYSEMVKRAYGVKTMRFSEIVLIVYPWAYSVCLQVIFAKFILQILHDQMGMQIYEDRSRQQLNGAGNLTRILISVLAILINFKNFLRTDLRQMLHSIGKFSVTGVVFSVAVIVLTALIGFTQPEQPNPLHYQSIFTMNYQFVELFKPFTSEYLSILIQGCAGVFFTFLNHQFIFPLISHLKKPTKQRVDKILVMTHLEEIFVYTLLGVLGYLLLSQHSDTTPIAPLVIASISILPLLLGKLALSGALLLTLPLQIFTAREYICEALDIQRSIKNIRLVTFVLVGSTFLIALIFQQVNLYFGLIGGTVGVLMADGIPGVCLWKLIPLTLHLKIILVFISIVGFLCFIGGALSAL